MQPTKLTNILDSRAWLALQECIKRKKIKLKLEVHWYFHGKAKLYDLYSQLGMDYTSVLRQLIIHVLQMHIGITGGHNM